MWMIFIHYAISNLFCLLIVICFDRNFVWIKIDYTIPNNSRIARNKSTFTHLNDSLNRLMNNTVNSAPFNLVYIYIVFHLNE